MAAIAAAAIVGGVALAAGIRLIDGPGSPPPGASVSSLGRSPSLPTIATASSTVVPSSSALPAPTSSRSAASSPVAAGPNLPVKGSGEDLGTQIEMGPGPDGSLYVAVPGRGGEIVTRLDRSGKAARGWPILLAGVDDCDQLLPVEDGTVRLLCHRPPSNNDAAAVRRSFALDAAGRSLPGWPVDVDNGTLGQMVNQSLVLLVNPLLYVGGEAGQSWPVSVTVIDVDGSVETGEDIPFVCCDLAWAVGTDYLAYGTRYRDWTSATSVKTDITGFGLGGARPGSPTTIDGIGSELAFDVDRGFAYLVVGSPNKPPARTVVLDEDGRVSPYGSAELPITSTGTSRQSDYPGAPIVGADGSAFVVSTASHRTTVMALDPDGKARAGWPYHVNLEMQLTGICHPGDTGCVQRYTTPQVSDSNVLYLLEAGSTPSSGGSLFAIGPNGKVRPGWPVGLRRAGSMFWSVTVNPSGGVWALAIEPERNSASATILSIANDSTVRFATTIVQP